MKQKGQLRHAITVLSIFIGLFVAIQPKAYGKHITPKRATDIAKRYITLPRNNNAKAQKADANAPTNSPYYIFNDAHAQGFVVVAAATLWAKCWLTALRERSTRSTPSMCQDAVGGLPTDV